MTALTDLTKEVAGALFSGGELAEALGLLETECGDNLPFCGDRTPEQMERPRFAALKLSEGKLERLLDAVVLAQTDWRDVLMAAGFGQDLQAHAKWSQQLLRQDKSEGSDARRS